MREDIDETSVDTETVLQTKVNTKGKRGPGTETTRIVEWSKEGYSNYEELAEPAGAMQIYTELAISHATTETEARVNPHGKRNVVDATTATNSYDGWGDWTYGVPRAERVATAASTASFTVTGKNGTVSFFVSATKREGSSRTRLKRSAVPGPRELAMKASIRRESGASFNCLTSQLTRVCARPCLGASMSR